jgi:integrase
MASISREPNGRRAIQFVAADGKRKSIRLGKVSQRVAEEIKVKVELLNAAVLSGLALDGETASWVAKIGDDLAEKLASVGLIAPRASATARLKEFIDGYIASRTDVKAQTVLNLTVCGRRLVQFFGAEKQLRDVSPGHADEFCAWLRSVYAGATASRTINRAKQLFRAAQRKDLIARNPFEGCKPGHQSNPARSCFMSRETAQQVIDACPDAEWRLIFALSRYGGLRCPSEHLALTWPDVDWERGRFRVHSSKLEHLESGGERWVPIFPELRPYLEEAFERAEPGTVYVINRYRDTNANLRTQLNRIIRKAGLTPWPKLFHNLRSTRQTELAAEFPLHVVCAWIGNKQAVAAEHYLQVTEADFQKAGQPGAKSGAVVVQIPVQQAAASCRTASQETTQPHDCRGVVRESAGTCDATQVVEAPRVGLEPTTNRLTAGCSTIELSGIRPRKSCRPAAVSFIGHDPRPFKTNLGPPAPCQPAHPVLSPSLSSCVGEEPLCAWRPSRRRSARGRRCSTASTTSTCTPPTRRYPRACATCWNWGRPG